ncbi:MAG: 30S ribosomal protein S2 [Verrucomicrobia bacterium]|nr:30S ribosomal protein S2 [Verrucomicrobiota bacterium]
MQRTEDTLAATIKDLLEAGCHFGHQTKRWNPKMKQYIFEARNGIHVIDLAKSAELLQEACEFLRKTTLKGGKILWVGTKKQAQEAIREAAAATQMFSVTERWVGGTLTNLVTIRRSVKRLLYIVGLETSGEMARMHKKEVSSMRREAARLHKNLDGIVNMEKQPAAMVVIDIKREENAVHEANRLGIPVVAIVDTNCDPDLVQYPIPSNDDAIRAVKLIIHSLTEPVVESLVELGTNLPPPAAAAPAPEATAPVA